ncbi:MAG: hypothetical protein IPN85_18875 [Flavobacteriales bacterium]|nr:hypothetical protein [Flavobacteriales bacterium]
MNGSGGRWCFGAIIADGQLRGGGQRQRFGPAQEVSTPGCVPSVADWMGSSIAAMATRWVVMKATPEDTRPIYVRRSDDGGSTWGDTVRVDPYDGLVSRFPSIDLVDANGPLGIRRVDVRGHQRH